MYKVKRACGAALITLAVLGAGSAAQDPASSGASTAYVEMNEAGKMQMAHLTVDSTLGDVLHHPAFAGFARHLLPWDDKPYDERLRLTDIGSILPYHTHVDPEVIVPSLNRMIDDVGTGRPVFYDFYSDAEKRADPTRKNAGLFYFRGKPGAPFCVIAPGGGFAYVGSVHEGFPHANEISKLGYNAFVLKYRAGQGGQVATADLAAAISYIFRNAAILEVSTVGYSLWGSSAGARMAAAIGSRGTARFGGSDLPKPSAVVIAYTGHTDVSAYEPPTFVVVGERDAIASPSTMRRRVDALRRAGTEVEFHEYRGLGHGFGLGAGTSAEGWVLQAVRFWARQLQKKN
jgi:acetyl esterase/lipase